ncbi:MAG: HDOD domain-containing protein [Planctomycetota bacterium]
MPSWLHKLLGLRPPPRPGPPERRRAPRPAAASSAPGAAEPGAFPAAPADPSHADAPHHLRHGPRPGEVDLMRRVQSRIEEGRFVLPELPSTSMALFDLASRPSADLLEVAAKIEADPVLASELLREANSALVGARVPADTLQDAIARLGLRRLRSLILALSVRGLVLGGKGLRQHAAEVWRQAYAVGSIARVLAPHVGMDRERAFLLGLLHDVGKIPILHLLSGELGTLDDATVALVGRLYLRFHERVGEGMARTWKLPPEVVAVAGRHHDFRGNTEFPAGAALCSLAHKMDLFLSLGAEREYRALAQGEEMAVLGLADHRRPVALQSVLAAWRELTPRAAA